MKNIRTIVEDSLHSPVVVTNHAIERANERFNIPKAKASEWIKSKVRHSEFISITMTDEGKEGRLFAKDGIAFVLNLDRDLVITVYKPFEHQLIVETIKKVALRELRKFERQENKISKINNLTMAELEVEKATCNLDILKSRSQSKKNALQARINAVQMRIEELNNEVISAKREKTNVAKSVAAYV
jgi:hypothetical protein